MSKIILIKILKNRYVEDFLNGNLYMNSDKFFTEIDSKDIVRFDKHEGADGCLQVKNLSIADTKGDFVPIGGIRNPVIFNNSKKEPINILCLYAYSDRDDDYFDDLNLKFGDIAIIIRDPIDFVKRVKKSASELGKKTYQSLVSYHDKEKYNGYMGLFDKFREYQYQNEFRFVVTGGNDKPLILNIGDIRDIVMVVPANTIPQIPRHKH